MKIANVIPIAKGVPKEKLSYFTSKDVEPGALVTIPLKKRIIPAIVSSVDELKSLKSTLKKSGFVLKSIKSVKASCFFDKDFIGACEEGAKYFLSSAGEVLKDFVPSIIFDNPSPLKNENIKTALPRQEIVLAQYPPKDRFQYYKSIIREEFARGHSVFLCMPAISDLEKISQEIQKGIENYTFILHGKIPAKKIRETWSKILMEEHPVLITATKTFLSLPRKDIGTIIMEEENSSLYKLEQRPHLDVRKIIEIICRKTKKRFIIGDSLIRTETFFGKEKNPSFSRPLSEAEQIIVDMKKEQSSLNWQRPKELLVISHQLKEIIEEAYKNNERVLLFINRKGHSPTTICQDCQFVILCDKCATPLVLHKPPGDWVCHKCLSITKSPERCPYCKSWRLITLGMGAEKVFEEIEKLFPKFKIFRMDSDIIKNIKQGKETAEKFLNSPGSILIGTEIIFSYFNALKDSPIERVGVVSLDSLFGLPDFRINEKIFHILLKLRYLAKKTFLIQSRLAESTSIFDNVVKGNISGFYKDEIENRKNFEYPPFKLLIKITKEGRDNSKLKIEIEKLKRDLEEWKPIIYPAFIPKVKNIYSWHLLLKLDPETWPDKQPKLYEKLLSLTPNWKIDIDPESLL